MDPKEIEVIDVEVVNQKVIKPYDDATIQVHAAKYGGERNLKEIPIYTNDNHVFWYLVKRPSKAILQAIAEAKERLDKKQDIKAITDIQNLMIGCVLEGDKQAYEHDGAIYSALSKEIGLMATEARSTLKN